MKLLYENEFELINNHSSSNQLKIGFKRAYRPVEYVRNQKEMVENFLKKDFFIPEKTPLRVDIYYYYPKPKSVKNSYPITRGTKDLDSTKAVLDALMTAGRQVNLKNKLVKVDRKGNAVGVNMFDDSQVIDEYLKKRYWDKNVYGLKVKVFEYD